MTGSWDRACGCRDRRSNAVAFRLTSAPVGQGGRTSYPHRRFAFSTRGSRGCRIQPPSPVPFMKAFLSETIGVWTAAGIRQWVRLTGKLVARQDAPWLECPMGPRGRIGAAFYARLAQRERLRLQPSPDAGLLSDFDALGGGHFDPAKVRPAIP